MANPKYAPAAANRKMERRERTTISVVKRDSRNAMEANTAQPNEPSLTKPMIIYSAPLLLLGSIRCLDLPGFLHSHLLSCLLSVSSIRRHGPLDHEEPTPNSHDAHTFVLGHV